MPNHIDHIDCPGGPDRNLILIVLIHPRCAAFRPDASVWASSDVCDVDSFCVHSGARGEKKKLDKHPKNAKSPNIKQLYTHLQHASKSIKPLAQRLWHAPDNRKPTNNASQSLFSLVYIKEKRNNKQTIKQTLQIIGRSTRNNASETRSKDYRPRGQRP